MTHYSEDPPAYCARLYGTREEFLNKSVNVTIIQSSIINLQFKKMKAMSKQQLADAAGVSVKVLMSWCRPYRRNLELMGLKPKDRVLPPHIVKFLAEKFCIDVD